MRHLAAIVVALLAAAGHAAEEKDVRIEAPIKSVGEHAVRLHVHGARAATIRVVVTGAEARV